MDNTWLTPPYLPAQDPVKVLSQVQGLPDWFFTQVVSADSFLRQLVLGILSSVDSWLNPQYYNPLSSDKTEAGVIANFVTSANKRVSSFPQSSQGTDPVDLGTEYGTIFINILKHIDSGQFNGGTKGVSMWDAWVAAK